MNSNQKALTYLAVAALALTALFAPWDLTGSTNHQNVTRFAPLFFPPDLGPWAKRELAASILWLWSVMGVCYLALLTAFRDAATTSGLRDERKAAASGNV